MPELEPIVGRYLRVSVQGIPYRVYFEEAGSGIPLVCLHTAGSDGRQYRHLLTDPEITETYRVLAFDLPWHGKSNPPAGFQDQEYRLTTQLYTDTIMAFCRAMELKKPVVMGCSMGGRIVLELALRHGDELRRSSTGRRGGPSGAVERHRLAPPSGRTRRGNLRRPGVRQHGTPQSG